MNFKRVENLLRWEIATQARGSFIRIAAIGAVLVLLTLFGWVFSGSPEVSIQGYYFPILIIAGAVMTSGAFREIHEETTRIGSLLRPATATEKIVSKTLVTGIGYWALFSLSILVAYGILQLLALIVFGEPAVSPMADKYDEIQAITHSLPAEMQNWWGPLMRVTQDPTYLAGSPVARALLLGLAGLVAYLPTQAVFMFGSVYFCRGSFGRTLLLAVGWGFTYFMVAGAVARLLLMPYADAITSGELGRAIQQLGVAELAGMIPNPRWMFAIGTTVTVALFWILSWLRLRETEG